MKATEILIKPIVTEKSNLQAEKFRRYTFKVNRKANKLQIKKAVEQMYGVTVTEVNTLVAPGKNKTRYTKAGFIKGVRPGYKKAAVTLVQGDTIDLYTNI
jgi:large subunit ribosomal protein L23